MGDEPTITYAIRELLERIEKTQNKGFSDLLARLDGKADKADVESLRSDLRHLGERTQTLEAWHRDEQQAEVLEQAHSDRALRAKQWTLALATFLVMAAGYGVSALTGVLR